MLYSIISPPQKKQISLPQVLRSNRFMDEESNNPGLQKGVQRGAAGCTRICEKAIQAVLDAVAAVAQITEHTEGPTNIPKIKLLEMHTHQQSLYCLKAAP